MPWVIGLQRLSLGVSQLNAWMSQQDLEPAFDRYCTKGSENVLNNNLDQALIHLRKSLDTQPRLTHAHLWLARIYCLSEEWDLAIENYLAYIDRRPDNPLAYMELATAYEASEMSSYDLSKSIDRIAIPEPNPKSVVAWQGSGLAASQMVAAGDEQLRAGKDEAALRWYIRAIWLQPNSAEAWFGIGKLLEQSGDLEVANEAYKMAWSFDPARFSSQYAESLDTLGDTEALESLLLQALKQFPESKYRFQWWRLILRTYRNQGKWDQVIQSGLSALEEYPHMVDLIVELGWAYYHRGDGPEKAKQVFQQGIAQDEQRPEGYFAMGQLFNKEKQYSEADEWFLKASQRDPDNKWYQLSRANNLRSGGSNNEAVLVYQDLIEKFPDYPQAYYELAAAYYQIHEFKKAAEAIGQAIALQTSPDEWYYLRAGLIYEALGDFTTATSHYQSALEVNPENKASQEGLERVKDH